MAILFVDLPTNSTVIFHSFFYVDQRVNQKQSSMFACDFTDSIVFIGTQPDLFQGVQVLADACAEQEGRLRRLERSWVSGPQRGERDSRNKV